jgi:hypothetical protein
MSVRGGFKGVFSLPPRWVSQRSPQAIERRSRSKRRWGGGEGVASQTSGTGAGGDSRFPATASHANHFALGAHTTIPDPSPIEGEGGFQ